MCQYFHQHPYPSKPEHSHSHITDWRQKEIGGNEEIQTVITKSAFKENLTYPNKKISKNLAGDHLFSTAGWLRANRGNLNCFTACTNRQLCP